MKKQMFSICLIVNISLFFILLQGINYIFTLTVEVGNHFILV